MFFWGDILPGYYLHLRLKQYRIVRYIQGAQLGWPTEDSILVELPRISFQGRIEDLMKYIRLDRLLHALTERMIEAEWEAVQHHASLSRDRGERRRRISKSEVRDQFNQGTLSAVTVTGGVVVSCKRLGGWASLEYAQANMKDVTDEEAWLSLSNAQDLSIKLTRSDVTMALDAELLPFSADIEADARGLASQPTWALDILGMENLEIFWVVRHRKMWRAGMTQADATWSEKAYYENRQLFNAVAYAAKAIAERAHAEDVSSSELSKLFGKIRVEIKHGLNEAGFGGNISGKHPSYKFVYRRLKYVEEWALAKKSPL